MSMATNPWCVCVCARAHTVYRPQQDPDAGVEERRRIICSDARIQTQQNDSSGLSFRHCENWTKQRLNCITINKKTNQR